MRFRDTRPEPTTGEKYLALSAGAILAEAFSLPTSQVFTPRGKDPHRSPMHTRFQAAVRRGFAEAARERPSRFKVGYWKMRREKDKAIASAMGRKRS